MKTRIFIGLAVMLMTLFGITAYANENNDNPTAEANIDGLNYFLDFTTHEATITTDHTVSGELNIPSEINYKGETFVVKGMAWCSFYNNQGLAKVMIPKTVEGILNYVPHDPEDGTGGAVAPIYLNPFEGCTALESIEVDKDNPSLKSVDGVLFSQDGVGQYYYHTNNYKGTGLYCYPEGKQQHIYTIPDGVEWIGGDAVSNNKYLTTLTIPNSMKHICTSAFEGCSNLKDLYCKADNVPVVWESVFKNVLIASATLHVPEGSIEKYKATSPWKDFGNIVALDNPNDTLHNHPKYYQDGDYWVQALVPWDFEERIHDYETEGSGENFSLYCFYVEGDTIIDNKEYKCVHAKIWYYDCEATYDHQPEGLIEGPQVANVLFMREDADGKQWRRLAYLTDEALLFDFSHPFEKGQVIRFCKHDHLSDVLENVCYESVQTKACSNSSRLNKALRSDDKAPEGYLYYNLEVSNVTTLELPNGEQVPFANGRIAFGWGDVYQGDLLHQFVPVCESFSGRFLYRVHQGQVVLQKQDNINRISSIIGTDVLSLFNKPKDTNKYFSKDQMATIILPTEPDASKGKYYRLDRCEKGKIIFEEELSPKARTPYIIVPKEDFSIDLNALDLDGLLRDTVSVKGASFIGSYCHEELSCQDGFYIDIIDATPDCQADDSNQRKAIVGALRACLIVNWDDPYNPGGSKGITEKRELVLLDNGTSLTPNPSPVREGSIYDLQGRRLSEKPAKGLYIQNGVKRVVR